MRIYDRVFTNHRGENRYKNLQTTSDLERLNREISLLWGTRQFSAILTIIHKIFSKTTESIWLFRFRNTNDFDYHSGKAEKLCSAALFLFIESLEIEDRVRREENSINYCVFFFFNTLCRIFIRTYIVYRLFQSRTTI